MLSRPACAGALSRIIMKFTHGAWLVAKGMAPAIIRRVCECRVDENSAWLAAVDRSGTEGVDRFEGVVLDVRVTSPMPGVIRVQITHQADARRRPAGFDLDYALSAEGVAIEDR